MTQELICFLHRLAVMHKDYAVVLCCLGAREALSKVMDKHSTQLLLASELRDLVTECEKYAQLCSNLTSSILAGCIQVRRGCGCRAEKINQKQRLGSCSSWVSLESLRGRSGSKSGHMLPDFSQHGPIRIWQERG